MIIDWEHSALIRRRLTTTVRQINVLWFHYDRVTVEEVFRSSLELTLRCSEVVYTKQGEAHIRVF